VCVLPSSPEITRYRRKIAAMALLCIIRTRLSDKLANIQGALFKALFLREGNTFFSLLAQDAIFNLVFSALQSTMQFCVARLGHSWRNTLNGAIAKDYFQHMAYYRLAFVDKRVENPEQVCSSVNWLDDRRE
jgi:ABC-type uncharacterized transport system fused permease/ATPase subunit